MEICLSLKKKKKKSQEVWEPLLQGRLQLFLSASASEVTEEAQSCHGWGPWPLRQLFLQRQHVLSTAAPEHRHRLRGAVFNTFPKLAACLSEATASTSTRS